MKLMRFYITYPLRFLCCKLKGHQAVTMWPGVLWLHQYADICGRCGKVWPKLRFK